MTAAYNIPSSPMHRVEQSIKRSRFITSVARASDPDTAREFIQSIKDEFPDATHNCWAFNAGPPGDTAKIGMSDDGEPHNSAGKPMLRTLLHSDVGEIVVVATRYFGGVKLGVGGLVRAYSGCVNQALEELPTMERITPASMELIFEYSHVDQVRRLMERFRATLTSEEYTDTVAYTLTLPLDQAEPLARELTELTNGTMGISISQE